MIKTHALSSAILLGLAAFSAQAADVKKIAVTTTATAAKTAATTAKTAATTAKTAATTAKTAATTAKTAAAPAVVAGDATKGADVFDESCGECHSVSKSMKNKKGPALFGVVGRQAASLASYEKYSPALKGAGIIWTADKLDAYITNPKKLVADGKMKFDGLSKATERADLIAFLAQQK